MFVYLEGRAEDLYPNLGADSPGAQFILTTFYGFQ